MGTDATLWTQAGLRISDGKLGAVHGETRLENEVSVTEVRVRRIPLLESVRAALRPGAMPVAKLEESIAVPDRRVLRRFLAHLASIGLVEVCRPPRITVSGWSRPLRQPPDRDGFLDVYRRASGGLGAGQELEPELRQVLGLLALMRRRAAGRTRGELRGRAPRWPSSGAVWRRRARTGTRPADGWPRPRTEGSGYDRLIARLDGEAAEHPVVIPDLSAGDEELSRPVDCLLRPLPGSGAAAVGQGGQRGAPPALHPGLDRRRRPRLLLRRHRVGPLHPPGHDHDQAGWWPADLADPVSNHCTITCTPWMLKSWPVTSWPPTARAGRRV
ncbi:hypothetical protein AB0K48_33670 [Nonomuraea sp. NPDC055795]